MKEKPEPEITELQKSRIISDAALLRDGAIYVLDKSDAELRLDAQLRLEVTERQRLMGKEKKHMYEWTDAEEESLLAMFQKYKIELGDTMSIKTYDYPKKPRGRDATGYDAAGKFAKIKNGVIHLDVELSSSSIQDNSYRIADVEQIIIWRDKKVAMVLDV